MPTKATHIRQFAAMFYDAWVLVALFMLATSLVMAFNGGNVVPSGSYAFDFYLLVVAYLYFDICWRKKGQTIGMMAWKLRIACEEPITYMHTLKRFVGGLVSWMLLGAGFVMKIPEKFSGTHLIHTKQNHPPRKRK